MASRGMGWTGLLKREGAEFTEWLRRDQVLSSKFATLASVLSPMLRDQIRTPADARDIWTAVPAVLRCCNDQATYEKRGAAVAYAWLHLLDRYVRTWLALERLVQAACLPMGRDGVRALDVGTGPGPAAFAVNDFYSAMVEFSEAGNKPKWRQLADVACFEFSESINGFRHELAERLHGQSQGDSGNPLSMCIAMEDFERFEPNQARKHYFENLRSDAHEYIDETTGELHSDPVYLPDDANTLAQSLHRYRLVVFSNFLTTQETVDKFENNIAGVLRDANPGTVLLLLGGKEHPYPGIYSRVDRIAALSGFDLRVDSETVTWRGREVEQHVYAGGQNFYQFLQEFGLNGNDRDQLKVRKHFEDENRIPPPASEIRAYRKSMRGPLRS